jgi:hypothetical protein
VVEVPTHAFYGSQMKQNSDLKQLIVHGGLCYDAERDQIMLVLSADRYDVLSIARISHKRLPLTFERFYLLVTMDAFFVEKNRLC